MMQRSIQLCRPKSTCSVYRFSAAVAISSLIFVSAIRVGLLVLTKEPWHASAGASHSKALLQLETQELPARESTSTAISTSFVDALHQLETQELPAPTIGNSTAISTSVVDALHQLETQELPAPKSNSTAISTSFVDALHQLPTESFQIVRLNDPNEPLVTSQSTVVTGYFLAKSKHPANNYDQWMANMLSTLDPVVVFTQESLVDKIRSFRNHALNATVIVVTSLDELPITKVAAPPKFSSPESFWQNQLDIDPERRMHKSYRLFWIWLSKSYFVTQAIRHNFFESQVYMYTDIGCYRNEQYNHKQIVQHTELVPQDRMLWMSHKAIAWPPTKLWNNKRSKVEGKHFFHSGSQAVGWKDTWIQYHKVFAETLDAFIQKDMFVGEDQTVLQSACMVAPRLCAYVPMEQVNDINYFGLRYVLYNGGEYQYSYPPEVDEAAVVEQSNNQNEVGVRRTV